MAVSKFLSAIITRALFATVALAGVWRVTIEKKDPKYWYLTFLFLPLIAEMIITLKRRQGQDYKWFSPPIFLFLVSMIPTIWLLELEDVKEKQAKRKCKKIDETFRYDTNKNGSQENDTSQGSFQDIMTNVCTQDWVLAFQQILLILLIVGRWLLPRSGGISRHELSQLLLIFVGTAADILEFVSETLSDVKGSNTMLIYIILGVWTWSMLQFPLHLAVVNTKGDNRSEEDTQEVSLLAKYSTDIWSIMEALFIQNGPFLVVRLSVMIIYSKYRPMLIFFAVKNFLVIILSIYQMCIICQDNRESRRSAVSSSEDPEE